MSYPTRIGRWPRLKKVLVLVILMLLISLLGGGFMQFVTFKNNASVAPTPPISVNLEPTRLVPLGQTMDLLLKVRSGIDAPNAEVVFDLPRGIVATKGHVRQPVSLDKDVWYTFQLQIQLLEPGGKMVSAGVTIYLDDGSRMGQFDDLFLDV